LTITPATERNIIGPPPLTASALISGTLWIEQITYIVDAHREYLLRKEWQPCLQPQTSSSEAWRSSRSSTPPRNGTTSTPSRRF
jgi:hypothetical protein